MYYQIEKMDGYYRIGSPESVFCYLIVGTEKAVLIDTGYGFGNLREAVRSVTENPLFVINTHGHCDHASGNGQFEEPCFMHELDMELCREHSSREMRMESIKNAKHSQNYQTGELYNALPEDFDEEAYLSMGTGNLHAVKEGDIFELGGATLEIMETPGHTKGGISIFYREKNLLFTGDEAGEMVWLFAEESAGLEVHIKTLKKMYAMAADGYISAHNPNIMHREDFPRYIRAAEEADYEKGEPFDNRFANGAQPRICALDGMTLKDLFKPGFAAVVIGEK